MHSSLRKAEFLFWSPVKNCSYIQLLVASLLYHTVVKRIVRVVCCKIMSTHISGYCFSSVLVYGQKTDSEKSHLTLWGSLPGFRAIGNLKTTFNCQCWDWKLFISPFPPRCCLQECNSPTIARWTMIKSSLPVPWHCTSKNIASFWRIVAFREEAVFV